MPRILSSAFGWWGLGLYGDGRGFPGRRMSTVSKVVFGVSVVLTVGTVAGVHLKQHLDRERLREGVFRDLERQARKKENLRILEEQISLTKKLEADRLQQNSLTPGSSQQTEKQ
ncbi:protein PET117 homolog, mitochondrial [Rhincodon typus]|uniref:protein PET117 homolog, mitochondrial n=1 Tax=Rhincodon typus TaxID=259920 RepID=UPI00202EE7B9|nr:protein PET117 homolog, mitochondrial [Rhincodon typus]